MREIIPYIIQYILFTMKYISLIKMISIVISDIKHRILEYLSKILKTHKTIFIGNGLSRQMMARGNGLDRKF